MSTKEEYQRQPNARRDSLSVPLAEPPRELFIGRPPLSFPHSTRPCTPLTEEEEAEPFLRCACLPPCLQIHLPSWLGPTSFLDLYFFGERSTVTVTVAAD